MFDFNDTRRLNPVFPGLKRVPPSGLTNPCGDDFFGERARGVALNAPFLTLTNSYEGFASQGRLTNPSDEKTRAAVIAPKSRRSMEGNI